MADANKTKEAFKCDVCQKQFSKRSFLQRHIKYRHDDDGDVKCQFCTKTFKKKSNCKRHEVVVHKKIRRHTCETCDDSFATKYQLLGHRRAIHKVSKLKCSSCGKSFTLKGNLRQHEHICKEKQCRPKAKHFPCEECNKTFKAKRYLKAHIKLVHTEAMKCICDTCGDEFSCQASLRRHSDRKH